jgi:hypothetical protein
VSEAALVTELVAAIGATGEREQRAARAAAVIRRFGGYRWVGITLLRRPRREARA